MQRRPDVIAEICGVSVETARRWRRLGRIPEPAQRLLAVADDLGAISDRWAGWCLRDDYIISPEGLRAAPGEVAAIWWYRQIIATIRHQRKDNVRVMVPDTVRLR